MLDCWPTIYSFILMIICVGGADFKLRVFDNYCIHTAPPGNSLCRSIYAAFQLRAFDRSSQFCSSPREIEQVSERSGRPISSLNWGICLTIARRLNCVTRLQNNTPRNAVDDDRSLHYSNLQVGICEGDRSLPGRRGIVESSGNSDELSSPRKSPLLAFPVDTLTTDRRSCQLAL